MCFSFRFSYLLYYDVFRNCFFSKHREKDGMELKWWGSGADLGEDEGGGTI